MEHLQHSAEALRCALELDVPAARQLWAEMYPHLYQPANADEMLHMLHLARTQLPNIPFGHKQYSETWLSERTTGIVARAVGTTVCKIDGSKGEREINMEAEMAAQVTRALAEGLDLSSEADNREIKRRMLEAASHT